MDQVSRGSAGATTDRCHIARVVLQRLEQPPGIFPLDPISSTYIPGLNWQLFPRFFAFLLFPEIPDTVSDLPVLTSCHFIPCLNVDLGRPPPFFSSVSLCVCLFGHRGTLGRGTVALDGVCMDGMGRDGAVWVAGWRTRLLHEADALEGG